MMNINYNGIIWRFRILCFLWSVTFLTTGITFVYHTLHECVNTNFDLVLITYSIGICITVFFISVIFSIHTYFYRKKYERSIQQS
jgi:hypothetical protein